MSSRYDILKNQHHGGPVWITAVATRGKVEQTLHALEWIEPGDYFAREATSGQIVYGLGPATPSQPSQAQFAPKAG